MSNKPISNYMKNNEESNNLNNLEKFIDKVMGKYLDEENKERKQIQGDIKCLDSVISEYLKCFIVLGYDLEGHKLILTHANTPEQKDALMEHLRDTTMKIMMSNG